MFSSFRAIWLSSAVSELGGAFFTFCNSILIYKLTGSPTALGIVWLIYYVPSFFMQLFIGPFIDRWSRKKTMIICQSIRAIIAILLFIFLLSNTLEIEVIYIFQIIIGLVMPIFTPANQAILPTIVDSDELPKANASLESIRQIMAILGPILAGVILDVIEIEWVLIIVSLAFIVSAIALSFIQESNKTGNERKPWISEFKEGFITYLSHPLIVWLGIFFSFVQFGVGVTMVTTLPYITTILNQPYSGYGMFIAGFPIGYIIGAFLSSKIKMFSGLGILFSTLFIGGCTYLSLAFTPWYILALITECIAGIVIAIFNIYNITLIQTSTPNHLMGKVSSIRLLIQRSMIPLGILTATIGVNYVSIRNLYFLIGSIICITSIVGYLLLKSQSSNSRKDVRC